MFAFRYLAILAVATLALAACGSSGSSARPVASPSASLVPAASPRPSTGPSTGPSGTLTAGQTATDWGRIWDTLPSGFPTYPGATPAQEASTGPASATFVVSGGVAKDVAASMSDQLMRDAYGVDAATVPLEDGSYIVEGRRGAGCRVQVKATPTGGLTTITVLYGADCPNP